MEPRSTAAEKRATERALRGKYASHAYLVRLRDFKIKDELNTSKDKEKIRAVGWHLMTEAYLREEENAMLTASAAAGTAAFTISNVDQGVQLSEMSESRKKILKDCEELGIYTFKEQEKIRVQKHKDGSISAYKGNASITQIMDFGLSTQGALMDGLTYNVGKKNSQDGSFKHTNAGYFYRDRLKAIDQFIKRCDDVGCVPSFSQDTLDFLKELRNDKKITLKEYQEITNKLEAVQVRTKVGSAEAAIGAYEAAKRDIYKAHPIDMTGITATPGTTLDIAKATKALQEMEDRYEAQKDAMDNTMKRIESALTAIDPEKLIAQGEDPEKVKARVEMLQSAAKHVQADMKELKETHQKLVDALTAQKNDLTTLEQTKTTALNDARAAVTQEVSKGENATNIEKVRTAADLPAHPATNDAIKTALTSLMTGLSTSTIPEKAFVYSHVINEFLKQHGKTLDEAKVIYDADTTKQNNLVTAANHDLHRIIREKTTELRNWKGETFSGTTTNEQALQQCNEQLKKLESMAVTPTTPAEPNAKVVPGLRERAEKMTERETKLSTDVEAKKTKLDEQIKQKKGPATPSVP